MGPTPGVTPAAAAPAIAPTERATEKKPAAATGDKGGGSFQQQRRNYRNNRTTTTGGGGQTAGAPPKEPKFEGRCSDLAGHIYDCANTRQADVYAKTTREIAEYVGRTYTYGTDVKIAVEKLAIPTLNMPADPPTDATLSQK